MSASNRSADQLLVRQCQARDQAAWKELDARLRKVAQDVLPKALKQDAVKTDELIQETLTALFRQKGALDACSRSADHLDKFLKHLLNRARNHYYRERDRRRRRELLLPHSELAKLTASKSPTGINPELIQRLAESLTPAEKTYLDWALAQRQEPSPCPYSASYARQLRGRIRKKAPLALGRLIG